MRLSLGLVALLLVASVLARVGNALRPRRW